MMFLPVQPSVSIRLHSSSTTTRIFFFFFFFFVVHVFLLFFRHNWIDPDNKVRDKRGLTDHGRHVRIAETTLGIEIEWNQLFRNSKDGSNEFDRIDVN